MIELDVAPLRPTTVTWGDISQRWRKDLPERFSGLLPEVIDLRMLGDRHDAVDPHADLVPELHCWLDLGRPSSLGLALVHNAQTHTDEDAVIEDYGRNLTPAQQARVATEWREVGNYFSLSSTGGRAEGDLDLMAALAITLAALTGGVVITEDNYDVMGTGVGVFTPDAFRAAMWNSD